MKQKTFPCLTDCLSWLDGYFCTSLSICFTCYFSATKEEKRWHAATTWSSVKLKKGMWMRPDTSWDYLKSSYSLGKHFHPFTTGLWVHIIRFSENFLWPDVHSFYPFLSPYWACIPWWFCHMLFKHPHPSFCHAVDCLLYSYLPTSIAFFGLKLRRMTFFLSLSPSFPSSQQLLRLTCSDSFCFS